MAKLRGVAPHAVEKRLKALFYGPAGVGKTTASIQFPKPYLIDTERGAENDDYVKALEASGGAYWSTTDPEEMIEEIRTLISTKHDYKTLIIDPATVIYNDLLDKFAESEGTDFGRHKGPADRRFKHMLALLLRLDMNVIMTSHSKTKWEKAKDSKGNDTITDAGQTFDCYPKLDYLFDLVFEIQKRGKDRVGIVRKTRISSFPESEVFPFCYDEIADRYGRSILERKAIAVALASPAQAATIQDLIDVRKDGVEVLKKALDKTGAATIEEMPTDKADMFIDYLKSGGSK